MGDVINFFAEKVKRNQRANKTKQAMNINRALCSGGKASSSQYVNWQSYEAMLEDIYKLLRSGEIKPAGMMLIFNTEDSFHYFMRGFEPGDAIETMADISEDLENY